MRIVYGARHRKHGDNYVDELRRCALYTVPDTEGMGIITLGVFAFCGDETSHVSRPMAGRMRYWAHRNAQRAHSQSIYPHAFVRVTNI